MIKRCSLVRRREDLTPEAFAEHWLGRHGELAQQLPGLRRYVINVIVGPPDAPYDGFAELWFDSEAAMEEALSTPIGQQLKADGDNFIGAMDNVAVDEHPIALDPALSGAGS